MGKKVCQVTTDTKGNFFIPKCKICSQPVYVYTEKIKTKTGIPFTTWNRYICYNEHCPDYNCLIDNIHMAQVDRDEAEKYMKTAE